MQGDGGPTFDCAHRSHETSVQWTGFPYVKHRPRRIRVDMGEGASYL